MSLTSNLVATVKGPVKYENLDIITPRQLKTNLIYIQFLI